MEYCMIVLVQMPAGLSALGMIINFWEKCSGVSQISPLCLAVVFPVQMAAANRKV